ncbi:MAG: YifB family Mg chelatase-like AAA ATPase, partial [Mucinivorans sp.]
VKAFSSTVIGIDAQMITVEVNVSFGLPKLFIVGLPDSAIRESEQRVVASLVNNSMKMPGSKIVVNLAPADLRKEGSHYDLPIAVGILAASGQINSERIGRYIILGELSLDGSILPIKGALPIAIEALKDGFEGVILPKENAREAAVVQNIKVYGVENLNQVLDILGSESPSMEPISINTREEYFAQAGVFDIDWRDVKGQEGVKRALEIAVAGSHNVLMIGPPGSGKSMLAARIPTIAPPMTLAEALEITKIHSVAGKIGTSGGLLTKRPFRSPHHIVSDVALVGGGSSPTPGEISLAHNGVLFLDELPEFSRHALEVLRGPLENHHINISRAKYSVNYPAHFMLVGAMNPCPCGYLNHPTKECVCSPSQIERYMGKISGPLMDRIDLHIEVMPVDIEAITAVRTGEESATVRQRTTAARERQAIRFKNSDTHSNSMMTPQEIERFCVLDDDSIQLIKSAIERLGLSARAYDRIIKVARTIADLSDSQDIKADHIAEAISYRTLDREVWKTKSLSNYGAL